MSSPVWAQFDHLENARKALISGDMLKLQIALEHFGKHLKAKPSQLNAQELTNGQMWHALLSAQFHQISGAPPAFLRIQQYETKKQLKDDKEAFASAVPHLKAAIFHLTRYTRLFRKTMRRANVSDQVTLISTRNRIEILKNSLRTVQNRIPILELLLRQWDRETPAQRKIRMGMLLREINKGRRYLEKVQRDQRSLRKQLTQQGKAIAQAQHLLRKHNKQIKRRQRSSQTMILTGATLGSIGVIGMGVGIGMSVYINTPSCSTRCAEDMQPGAWVALAIGGALTATGLSLLIVGLITKPHKAHGSRGIHKAHKRYHQLKKKQPDETSAIQRVPRHARVLWASR